MARRRGGAPRKPRVHEKRINVQLIKPDTAEGTPIYALVSRTIEKHHEHLTNARIAVAWNKSWKPDADGRVTIGKLRKASDLDRELAPYDFVLILRKEFWDNPHTTDEHRAALIDHELCHGQVRSRPDGEPMVDEKGRRQYRLRKHDVEEFSEILYRHGPHYKRALEDAFIAWQTRQMEIASTKDQRIDESDAAKGKAALGKVGATAAAGH